VGIDRFDSSQCFHFGHELSTEPLLALSELAALAGRLSPDSVELTDAAAPLVLDTERQTRRLAVGEDGEAAVLDIAAQRGWVAMRHVETDPRYGALVERTFRWFIADAGPRFRRPYRPEGYIFIGASGAVTPTHVDHEHNAFFQISGIKHFHTGGFPSVAERDRILEGMYHDHYGSTTYAPHDAQINRLTSGDGLYVSPHTVHAVENVGDDLAISFSVVFHDAWLDTEARAYTYNGYLRRLGLTPRSPLDAPIRSRAKALAVSVWRSGRGAVERFR
jgi:hypothetical protein